MSLRWEDERYVRVYTRDTVTWKMLSWQGKVVLALLFRKVDRAGLLDLGEHGVEGLAATLELPVEVVEAGMASILKSKTVAMIGEAHSILFIPHFLEAQEAVSNDAQRKRDQRERAVARATLGAVTIRDNPSQNVTNGHATGHSVTLSSDSGQKVTPCLTVPSEDLSPARVISPEQQWLDSTGTWPGTGLCEALVLSRETAIAKGEPPDEYLVRALNVFSQWVDGIRPGRRPQKSPQKFVEHFARVQEILDGKRKAVPDESPLPHGAKTAKDTGAAREIAERIKAKRAAQSAAIDAANGKA